MKTMISYHWLCSLIGISPQRLCEWRFRKGAANRHNGNIPRHNWLSAEECAAIVSFYREHIEDGYRRCAYMMIDQNIVWAAPSTVYKVLCREKAIRHFKHKTSKKGKGFEQPLKNHEHWHVDITYICINRTHCFLTTVIDGRSRYIIASRLTERMTDADIGIATQMAHEHFPECKPRIISDNGGQFTGKEFHKFIGLHGFTHVRTSPNYPQSNGKIERWHKSLKTECVRKKSLSGIEHAREVIDAYIHYYNTVRLHSAIGYITPADMLAGRQQQIHEERDGKLSLARQRRGTALDKGGQ